ncbi:hypothetical protein NC652_022379 [Populus alba x Populus x berolinensis]|nr:hypothetical protein NC652_022379 [Populus alba x Populus x berolinensis]
MREERGWRDEAVDKWKKLYLAIKAELDELISDDSPWEMACYWRA